MLTALKALVFVTSSLGLGLELKRRANLDACLVPLMVIAVQVVVLYFGSLFNILVFAGVLLLAVGLVCLARALVAFKLPRSFDWKTILLFVAVLFMLAVVTLAVHGHSFLGYDTYAYWGIFVKLLLGSDSLPSDMSPVLIAHHSYVPGSSLYIWFVARFIARPESMQMLAQAYMTLAAILSIFAYAPRSFASAGLFCLLSYLTLNFVGRVQDLTVDALLPAVGVASIVFAWLGLSSPTTSDLDDSDDDKIFRWRLILSDALLCFAMFVKNAGVVYALPALFLTLRAAYKRVSTKQFVATTLFPLAARYLWIRHDRYAFTMNGYHDVSLAYYKTMLEERSMADIQNIVSKYFKTLLEYRVFWLMLGAICIVGILMFIYVQDQRKRIAKYGFAIFGLVAWYALGLLLTYCIDMPLVEAQGLASFWRYWPSFLLGVLLLASVYVLQVDASTKTNLTWTLVAVLAFAPLTLLKEYSLFENERIPWFRAHMEELLNQHDELWRHTIYVLQASDEDKYYRRNITRYVMESRSACVTDNMTGDGYDPPENFDYIILFDEEKRDEFDAWVAENYPEQLGEDIICTLDEKEVEGS